MASSTFMGNEGIYSMGEGIRKSLSKIFQAECFTTILQEGLTRETLTKTIAWHDSSASSHVLLTCPFCGNPSRDLVTRCTDLQLSLSIHQLNTKPNTIRSQKIQGTKLKKLHHFLSWNKANIKHSCKSQIYTFLINSI